jgi:hypothetical protein
MQQIAFGTGAIEPLLPKCMDHELADPLAYYRAIVTTLARLAAAHKSGALSPQIETLFPFDPEVAAADDPIPWDERQVRELVAQYAAFAASVPQLLPANIRTPSFIAQLESDAVRFLHRAPAIKRFLQADLDFIALCHYNANIDNAWFWRDASGALHCGLLDWGRVRQMNVAYALWGSLCGAPMEVWDNHLDELLDVFIREVQTHGGPRFDRAELKLRLDFYVAMIGLSMMMNVPALVLSRLPEVASATSPLDPIMHKNEVARSFLHVFTNFLNLWQTHEFGTKLARFERQTLPSS